MNSRSASIFCALFLCIALVVWFAAPLVVSADHSFTHTVQELRMHFNALVESFLGARWNGASDSFSAAALLAVVDDTRIQKLETELQSYQSRIEQLKSKSQTDGEKRELKSLEDEVLFVRSRIDELRGGGLRLTRTLRRGSSGNDVKQLQEFLAKDKEVYPEGLATGYFGKLTEDAVKRFQEKNGIEQAGVVGPKTRAALVTSVEGVAPVGQSETPKGLLVRTLERGISGDDVKGAQGLLNRFPDIYPQGSATGFYGTATENAVKKLQEKLGLPVTGGIDDTTKKKINELAAAVERKHPPKISTVAPAEISVGTKVTITGSGFMLEGNSLFVKGKTILTNLTSHDGTAVVFSVPFDISCEVGQACPIKIINANGISNAKPFKLAEAVSVPEPLPDPTPTPTPAAIAAPTVSLTASSLTITAGQPFTLTVSGTSDVGLASVWWYGDTTGVIDANVVSSYPSTPTPVYTSPDANPAKLDKAYMASFTAAQAVKVYSFSSTVAIPVAGVYKFGANSRDVLYPIAGEPHQASEGAGLATVKITVVAPTPPPVAPTLTSISPSIVTTGMVITLNGAGFTLANNTVTFTGSFTEPNQVLSGIASSDGATLAVTIPATMPCRPLVVSQCGVFVTNQNGQSNRLSFWLGQHIDPVRVLTPNGGEQLIQGASSVISASGGKSEAFSGAVSISYALVDAFATEASDPSALILGWIQHDASSIAWNAKRLCDFDNANAVSPAPGSCWDAAAGNYKILAVGRDTMNLQTIWNAAANAPGNIDVSDQPFSIIPAPLPSLGIVSPNGGEAYKYGDTVTITWEAKNIASKLVNIRLLKSGNLAYTIASNVAQSAENGMFMRAWTIPSTLAVGTDYAIEISDATNSSVKDVSDGQFRIANLAALQIYGPNGGETAMRGFSALLFWTYSGYYPTSINVHLYKGGVFYRTLATGVKPVGFSGYTFLQASYPTNSRYAEVPIALDIPDGDDYTLEIVDGADATILDKSDAPFRIISLPSPVTFTGRMIDALSGAPMSNIVFSESTSSGWVQRFITGANGEFSFSTTTASLIDPAVRNQLLAAGWPPCNDATTLSVSRFPDFPRTAFGGWFGGLYPISSVRRQYFPVVSSVMNLGDVPLWPSTDFIHTFTDIPSGFMAYYSGGGMGNINYTIQHGLQNTPPLGVDTYIQYKNKSGILYNSPVTRFSTDTRCQIATNSFMEGAYQWEPYPIGILYSATGGTTGALYTGKLSTFISNYGYSAGIAPLTWSVAFGTLPPGLSLNGVTGEITGIPTTIGTYIFGVKVKDANGVRAARDMTIIIR